MLGEYLHELMSYEHQWMLLYLVAMLTIILLLTVGLVWVKYSKVKRVAVEGKNYNWELEWQETNCFYLLMITWVVIWQSIDEMVLKPDLWQQVVVFLLVTFGIRFVHARSVWYFKKKYGLGASAVGQDHDLAKNNS